MGIRHTVSKDIQVEPQGEGTDDMDTKYIYHYTFGLTPKPPHPGAEHWRLDKRMYYGAYPSDHLRMPPACTAKSGFIIASMWNEAAQCVPPRAREPHTREQPTRDDHTGRCGAAREQRCTRRECRGLSRQSCTAGGVSAVDTARSVPRGSNGVSSLGSVACLALLDSVTRSRSRLLHALTARSLTCAAPQAHRRMEIKGQAATNQREGRRHAHAAPGFNEAREGSWSGRQVARHRPVDVGWHPAPVPLFARHRVRAAPSPRVATLMRACPRARALTAPRSGALMRACPRARAHHRRIRPRSSRAYAPMHSPCHARAIACAHALTTSRSRCPLRASRCRYVPGATPPEKGPLGTWVEQKPHVVRLTLCAKVYLLSFENADAPWTFTAVDEDGRESSGQLSDTRQHTAQMLRGVDDELTRPGADEAAAPSPTLLRDVAGSGPWFWAGSGPLSFMRGGVLITPWGEGQWGTSRTGGESAPADAVFADFAGSQHKLRMHVPECLRMQSRRKADDDVVGIDFAGTSPDRAATTQCSARP
jgi:hypothetical protein